MTIAVAVYSVLLLVGALAVLTAVVLYVQDQWRHRTEDGEALAARLSNPRPGAAPTTTVEGQRVRIDVGLALTAYGLAFVGDVVLRSALVGFHPGASAWWAIPDALVAVAVQMLLDRRTRAGERPRTFLTGGGVAYVLALVLGLLGATAALA